MHFTNRCTQSNFNLCMNSAVIEIRKKICSKNYHSKDYMTIEFVHGLKLLSVLQLQLKLILFQSSTKYCVTISNHFL
jgi:hypothetical protein